MPLATDISLKENKIEDERSEEDGDEGWRIWEKIIIFIEMLKFWIALMNIFNKKENFGWNDWTEAGGWLNIEEGF